MYCIEVANNIELPEYNKRKVPHILQEQLQNLIILYLEKIK